MLTRSAAYSGCLYAAYYTAASLVPLCAVLSEELLAVSQSALAVSRVSNLLTSAVMVIASAIKMID